MFGTRARRQVAPLRHLVVLAALALLLTAVEGRAVAAHAHATHAPGPDGLSERERLDRDVELLGEEHAAEHALQRAAAAAAEDPVAPAAPAPAVAPEQGGEWSPAFQIPVMGINAVLLPTSKVLLFSYPTRGDIPYAEAWLWTPRDGRDPDAFKKVNPPIDPDTGEPVNLFCAGNSLLPDGRVLVAGGNLAYDDPVTGTPHTGLDHLYTFDPWTETWTRQPDLRRGRWYPSQLTMPDGRTVILGGRDETGRAKNRDIELFTPPAAGEVGTLSLLGGPDVLGRAGTPPIGSLYPNMFWMPSGRGLVAGDQRVDSWFLNRPSTPTALSWTDAPDAARNHYAGTAVLVPGGTGGSTRVWQIGGQGTAGAASTTSEQFDETNGAAGWRPGASLNVARMNFNTVLLPDGSMVTVGGASAITPNAWTSTEERKQVELWDPATNTWRLGAAQAELRTYHSTALLLPSGRVLSAGDDVNGAVGQDGTLQDTGEVYSPPYLYRGPRPTTTSVPSSVGLGQTFRAGTPSQIARAVLVAPGAVTHTNDMNQRHVELTITGRAQGTHVDLRAPANGNIAPPGYYMLFLLDTKGVPSVARWIRLR